MKIKGGWLTGNAPPNARGRVVIRDTRWGIVAQAWPRKRSKRWSPSQYWWYTQFKIAAYMTSTAMSIDIQTATAMAKGTQQVPRDILMMCAYGTYYQITMPDGTLLIPSDKTIPPQLTITESIDMIDASMWDTWSTPPNSTSAFAFKGCSFIPSVSLQLAYTVARWNINLTMQYKLIIAEIDATGLISSIPISAAFSPTVGGSQNVQFETPTVLTAGQRYAIMVGRTDDIGTYPLSVYFPTNQQFHGPINGVTWARIASANPQPGDTVDITSLATIPIALYANIGE